MSKGGSQSQKGLTTADPWNPAGKVLKRTVLPGAEAWGNTPLSYTGPSYIGQTPLQEQGLEQQQGYYQGQGQTGVVDPTQAAWQQSLDPGAFMNAPGAMNPLDLYAKQVGRNLDENIRPGYAMGAAQAGQYGGYSSERAQNERLAERNASEAIADYGGNLFSNLYGQGLQMRQNAISQAPGVFNLGAAPGQQLYNLGGIQRGEQYQEQQMGNARREFEQMEPMRRMQALFGIAGPAAQLGGDTTNMNKQGTKNSALGTIAGIGLTGLGLANGMGGMGGLGGLGGMNQGLGTIGMGNAGGSNVGMVPGGGGGFGYDYFNPMTPRF